MNAPDPIGELDKLVGVDLPDPPSLQHPLQSILARLVRIETRLVRLMLHHGVSTSREDKENT